MRRRTPVMAIAMIAAAAMGATATASARADTRTAPARAADPVAAADAMVAGNAPALFKSQRDTFKRVAVHEGGNGLQYVSYERTYRGLPVVGGDAVVVTTDAAGRVLSTSVAQSRDHRVGTTADGDRRRGPGDRQGAARHGRVGDGATPGRARLGHARAWPGRPSSPAPRPTAPSKLHVFVDATDRRGRRQRTTTCAPAPATASTTAHGHHQHLRLRLVVLDGRLHPPRHPLRRPERRDVHRHRRRLGQRLRHQPGDRLRRRAVRGAEGMGHARRLAGPQRHQRQRRRLPGPGRPEPGQRLLERQLHQLRPQLRPTQRQATPIDVVAHEFGHAIFQTTPGGAGGGNENGGLNEATGDIFGALTEHFANNPNDPPDFLVGEEVNLVGSGPIRNMYNPSRWRRPELLVHRDPEHRGARGGRPAQPLVLPARRRAPTRRRQPTSPTCNGSTSVTGIGIQNAGRIYYNAMLAEDLDVALRQRPARLAQRGGQPVRRELGPVHQRSRRPGTRSPYRRSPASRPAARRARVRPGSKRRTPRSRPVAQSTATTPGSAAPAS